MFVRFAVAVVLVALIAVAGIQLEKRNLELRRAVGLQHYRLEVMERRHALDRLKVQQLGAPARMIESIESGELQVMAPSPESEQQNVMVRGSRAERRVR